MVTGRRALSPIALYEYSLLLTTLLGAILGGTLIGPLERSRDPSLTETRVLLSTARLKALLLLPTELFGFLYLILL